MQSERRQRVRLEQPEEQDRRGRTGCIALGAVLGILVGVMVALYGLPPILKALYGEKTVAPGATATVGSIGFHVRGFTVGPDNFCAGLPGCPSLSIQVDLEVTAGRSSWNPNAEDFQIEVAGVNTWIEAMEPLEKVPDTQLTWLPAQTRRIVLRFPVPLGAPPDDTQPVAVHVASPRVRLELDGSLRR